jgi:hypothetical protein
LQEDERQKEAGTNDIAGQQEGEESNGRQGKEGQRKRPEAKHRQAATEDSKKTGETTQKNLLTILAVMRQRIHICIVYACNAQ